LPATTRQAWIEADGLRVTTPGGERRTWHGYIQVDVNRFAA
jgi:hypothetical protein